MSEPNQPEVRPPTAATVRAEAARHGTAMLRRFGWFHWLLGLRRPLSRVHLDDASAERIRDAADRGPIVYVLLKASNLDHLALNQVLNGRHLPLSVWANGITQFFWEPVVDAWSGLFRRTWARVTGRRPQDPVASGWITRALAQDLPLTVFLEDAGLGAPFARRVDDPLQGLLDSQRNLDQPIQLLPVLVVWQRGLARPVHPALKLVLPDPDRTWGLLRLWKLAWYASDTFVQVGEPVDLQTFTSRVETGRQRRTLYVLLRRYLRREGQVIRGPSLPGPADLRRMVLENPPMRALARDEAARDGVPVEKIHRKMEREYDRIAAHMRWPIIRVLEIGLRPLWTRVYRGVDAPQQDMERIREAMRGGAAIVLPSHKSHFDYLLLAWVFYQHKLTLPHVVAGANLAIPVVSFFLRSAGGFFIKRSFAGERLHPAIVARYLRELVHHGAPLEFYLEGGRTRSGKLLPPKVGILGMVFEAAALRPSKLDVTLLPVALAYEQVAEQGSYVRELGGEAKQTEDLNQLARATRVVRRRLGRVYLRVGEPIPLAPLVDATDKQPGWLDRTHDQRKHQLDDVALQVMYQVGLRTVLLPTTLVALALMAHHRRGISQADLHDRAQRFQAFVEHYQVPQATTLQRFDEALRLTLARLSDQRILEHFELEGERVWAVRVERRLELDFAKNQGLHVFSCGGLVAAALRARPPGPVTVPDLHDEVAFLARLWRRELILDPHEDTAARTARGVEDLVRHGALFRVGQDQVEVDRPERIGEIHGLYRPFLEAYRAVLHQAPSLVDSPHGRKEWIGVLQKRRDALLASGIITRPEALSLVTLENAVKVLIEDKLLTLDDRERLVPDVDTLRATHARLLPMVGR